MAATEPAVTPEQPEAPKPPAAETPAETPEASKPPEKRAEIPETPEPPEVPEVPDPEPGSPRRRKRPRESAPPGLTVPRLDAGFWQQLIHESRASREASRRERYANLLRF
jgi:hypothetical protein